MNKSLMLIFLVGITCITCGKKTNVAPFQDEVKKQTPKDTTLFGLTIPVADLEDINTQSGKQAQQLRINWGSSYVDGKEIPNDSLIQGIEWYKVPEKTADRIILQYQAKLKQSNIFLFKKNIGFKDDLSFQDLKNDSWETYYDLAAYPGVDVYSIMKIWDVNGVNYDVENEDVIKKIKEWDQLYGVTINTIDMDRIHGSFTKRVDVKKMTEEIYAFCPDVVDQGYGSMEEFQKDLKQTNAFWMWWD